MIFLPTKIGFGKIFKLNLKKDKNRYIIERFYFTKNTLPVLLLI